MNVGSDFEYPRQSRLLSEIQRRNGHSKYLRGCIDACVCGEDVLYTHSSGMGRLVE